MAFAVRPRAAYWTVKTGRYWIDDDKLCSTQRGTVSKVYEANYPSTSSGSSCLLSARVRNLHRCSSEIDTVWGETKKKTRQKKALITLHQSDTRVGYQQGQNMFSLLLRHPELPESVSPAAVHQPFCQPYAYHPRLFLLFLLSTSSTNFRRGTPAHPRLSSTPLARL